ncbi:hypothetical protein FIV42_22365 [Persicimonas caeni]|uniref:CpXC domain-containing protein n=1 Tax=Persicimonas caeni TaxID=2292766 RepID=A0A4Y6PZF4_PERCE|nr:CpXC domain-containing protein [Persicimonas caeni]QDG53387.1 hypothetical protein FIV42_22365 [Persicimonas caeni]QED34608.1 hypothetical protein FRD00_22360 [Persicimonas caeni]
MASSLGEEGRSGQFGTTARTSIQVTDHNGSVFRAEVYRCVNVTTDPELREALTSGALYEVASPSGEGTFELAVPIQYHDEELELFALVVPEVLRHREFALRSELLDELAAADEELPAYMRAFETVCGVGALEELEARYAAGDRPRAAEPGGDLAADGGAPQQVASDAVSDEERQELERARQEVEETRALLEQDRNQLDQDRQQLDEVASRIDRERARMDEVERELADERASIDELRSELEAMKLNLEQERLRLEQGGPISNAEESTQVVTDDQFIEVVEHDERSEPVETAAPHEATELIESPYVDANEASEPVTEVRIERVDEAQFPERFDEVDADPFGRHVAVIDGRVVAGAKVSDEVIEGIAQAAERSFFVQFDAEANYPVIGLLFAGLDDEQQACASVGWTLDVADSEHELVLNRLGGAVSLQAALYDDAGELRGVWNIAAPLAENVEWIRQRAEKLLTDPDFDAGSYEEVAQAWLEQGDERLGTMRHNFHTDSFAEATTPAQLLLACGIVGFWSTPEKLEYLVANRSFPIDQFEAIQRRVVRRSLQHGLYLNPELRHVAVYMGLAADETELCDRLINEFAELSVGLRENDLDPVQEFENWEQLIELAEEVGVTLDADVLELAEASLKRAQDFQETDIPAEVAPPAPVEPAISDVSFDEIEIDELVVARRSETTGVTYFLPDDAVLDTFDDLASMPREDLELLLEDAKGRLEAAQMLIERFGAEGTQTALEAAEQMNAPQVAALARFVESKAEGLEAELVRCVESGGPSATYIAGRALASIRSTSALPTLLDAYCDDQRRGDKEAFARALATYGKKLLPQLKRTIKKEGHDDALVALIRELERQHEGVLAELAKDRSKKVRAAANEARS